MKTHSTLDAINRFNRAFQEHDPSAFVDLVAQDCVMVEGMGYLKG